MVALRQRAKLQMLALAWCGLLGISSCYSPTLPLPPPEKPDVLGTDQAGLYEFKGSVTPEAGVFALNRRTGLAYGQETLDDGRYDFTFVGEEGDGVEFWYSIDTRESPSIIFELKANQ